MMHGRNPLAHSQLDDDPDDLEYYGYDPQGPSPLESNNVVVVPQITLGNNNEEITSFVLQNLNSLSQSSDMGVEIYVNALHLVEAKIRELNAAIVE